MAFQNRNKFCYFKENGIHDIDYKDVKLLRRFVNDQGKICQGESQEQAQKCIGNWYEP